MIIRLPGILDALQILPGFRVTLVGRQPEPVGRQFVVAVNTEPVVIHDAEVGLGVDESLCGSLAVPVSRGSQVALNAGAFVVEDPQVELRLGIPQFRQR